MLVYIIFINMYNYILIIKNRLLITSITQIVCEPPMIVIIDLLDDNWPIIYDSNKYN